MAEQPKPAATGTPRPRHKIRTIRIWLWVLALLFASMFFLSQCAMSKPQAKSQIIASCVKNGPFNPAWESELAKFGLSGQSDKVIEPYCQCMWDEPLEAMSTQDIETFAQMSPADKLQKLGGEAAMVVRHQQCLKQQGASS